MFNWNSEIYLNNVYLSNHVGRSIIYVDVAYVIQEKLMNTDHTDSTDAETFQILLSSIANWQQIS